MGASSSKSESRPVDMTPEAFKALQEPFAQVLGMLINGSGQTVSGLINGYQGPLSAPMGDSENAILAQLMQKTGSNAFMPQSTVPTGAMPGANKQQGMGLPPTQFPSLNLYDPTKVTPDPLATAADTSGLPGRYFFGPQGGMSTNDLFSGQREADGRITFAEDRAKTKTKKGK